MHVRILINDSTAGRRAIVEDNAEDMLMEPEPSKVQSIIESVALIHSSSLVHKSIPSFSMLHASFSACNIEKLGMGLGMRLTQ